LLLFDRLVVPYPESPQERQRWLKPNPRNPRESWMPGRLDEFLEFMGTETQAGLGKVPLAWRSPWSPERWRVGKRLPEVAKVISENDNFAGTREILMHGADLPAIVEAVPSYPTYRAWRQDAQPEPEPAEPATAATVLVALARPLLLPAEDRRERFRLFEVIELASDPDFRRARSKYHQWLREMVSTLGEAKLADAVLDPNSVKLLKERLDQLMSEERQVVTEGDRKRRWTRGEWAFTAIGTGGKVADAIAQPGTAITSLIGEGAQLLGWASSKKAATSPERPLTAASMFVQAQQRLAGQKRLRRAAKAVRAQ
jgi:hypothetical protein